jgi:aminopeptidase N
MENVGAVTITDRFLRPADEMTNYYRSFIGFVLLHELAHMWFGDLVTMQWWDDLWLKESFADFCALVSLSEVPEIREMVPNPE